MSKFPDSLIVDGSIQYDVESPTLGMALPTQLLPKEQNYADDLDIRARIDDEIVPVIQQARNDRLQLHEEWHAIRNMELLKHDEGQKYKGRSNAYIPVFNRNSNTLTSSLSRGLFPSDEYFDVGADAPNAELAKDVKTYLQWEFEVIAGVRRKIKPFIKQLVNYGNSPLKFTYQKQQRYEGRKVKLNNIYQGAFRPTMAVDGLQVSARSLFNVYVYPQTAESIADASMVFEDIKVAQPYVEQMVNSGKWKNGEDALHGEAPPEFDDAEDRALVARELTAPVEHAHRGQGKRVVLTEVWTYLQLPKSAYMPDEDPQCPLPVLIILANNVPVYVDRNPFWHQTAPYLWARTNVEPGVFYGYGFGTTVRGLQYLTNDYANQMNDVGTYSLNPVALVNPAALAGPLKPLKPGAIIPVTDIQTAMRWDRPPVELVQYGTQLFSMYSGMAQDFGGAPPILQGQAAGKTGKTATGAQILQRNAMMPLQDVVEDIELEVMIPLLRGAWINAQQFRAEDTMVRVAGKSLKVSPEMLALDCDFRWLASSQAVNQQMRAQQAIQLIQALMPIVPLVMQQGYVVDPVPLIRRIYTDGMGFRGFEEFIKKLPMAMGMPGVMAPAANPGAPQMQQGDLLRSALEQIPGAGPVEMAPGEGEDFMEVRQNADAIAADAGANYGVE